MPEAELSDLEVATQLSGNEKDTEGLLSSKDLDADPKTNGSDEQEDEWLDVLGSGDLKIKTIQKGKQGTRPQNLDICTIKVEVTLEDGKVVEQHDALEVELNGSEVVQGLDLILSLLDVGQKVTAIVKPRFGYGALGLQPEIPPNTTLIYNVELLKVEYPEELTNVPFDKRKEKATFKKEKGNWWYARGDATKAIQCYRAALDALQDSTPFTSEEKVVTDMPEDVFRTMVQQRLIVYNNLAAAQLMINAYDSALSSVDNVIELEPNNVKALFRRGKILFAKGNTDEAVEVFTKVSTLEPENIAVKKELNAALKRQAKERLQAKSLYKKMLGTEASKKSERNEPTPPPIVRSPWTKILGATAVATVAFAIAYGAAFRSRALTFWD